MPFTPARLGTKLRDLRAAFEGSLADVANATGIERARLTQLESGNVAPTGDEILIIADYFGCDFAWLIEDEAPNPDENVRTLFRLEGERLRSSDRHAIKDFLHLCKTQALVEQLLNVPPPSHGFGFAPSGTYYIGQGQQCAQQLRVWHGLSPNAIVPDLFDWFRKHGMRIFRRALPDSPISGLFVDHPVAGRCILVNYSEDIYRQRFSAGHEVGHALMDRDTSYNISDDRDQSGAMLEIRANSFASAFLMPPELLRQWGSRNDWRDANKVRDAADKLWVSIPALLTALRHAGLMDDETSDAITSLNLRLPEKREPELEGNLTPSQRERKSQFLAMGLHDLYVDQCLEAHRRGLISLGKLAEAFLVEPTQVGEVAATFGRMLNYG